MLWVEELSLLCQWHKVPIPPPEHIDYKLKGIMSLKHHTLFSPSLVAFILFSSLFIPETDYPQLFYFIPFPFAIFLTIGQSRNLWKKYSISPIYLLTISKS